MIPFTNLDKTNEYNDDEVETPFRFIANTLLKLLFPRYNKDRGSFRADGYRDAIQCGLC